MAIITRDQRLVARSYWMVSHRWFAIAAVAALTWAGPQIFDVEINEKALYFLSLGLVVENLLTLWLLEFVKHRKRHTLNKSIRLVIHFQIFCDLVFLTGILHFTGGIENPLFLVYIFHMVIASILLSRTGAFIQTTIALALFGMLTYFEYAGIIGHYCLCLEGQPNHLLYKDLYYITRTFGVFAFTSFILVYLATSIGHRLRSQEDRLTGAIRDLRRNDDIKNEYVLRITHDIKSHLAAIQTSLSVLTEGVFGKLEGKQKEFLDRSFNRTVTLTSFARNLLQMTKLRLQNKLEKEAFPLGDLIVKTINDHNEEMREKGISVKLELDETIDSFYGNKTSIEGVFQNLFGNALKYSTANGQIEIKTRDRRHKIRIEVNDNGIGIPYKELSKIFNEFYRASNVKGTGVKGSGVGLSLVKEIVKRHEGKIWAENNEEQGSKFIVELPKL